MKQATKNRLGVVSWIWQHPANQGKQATALAKAAAFQARGRLLRRPTVGTIGRNARFLATPGSTAAAKMIYANPPDLPEMAVWQQRLNPDDLFVDVGANIGTYTLFAADLGCEVVAVEPGPTVAELLRHNLALNDFPVEVVEAALMDQPGRVSFDAAGTTTARVNEGEHQVEVKALTLDEVLGDRHAAGVKIDVEGVERLVVEGGQMALAEKRISCLQIEWHTLSRRILGETRQPIVDILRRHGYSTFRPDSTGRLVPDVADFGADVFALPDQV